MACCSFRSFLTLSVALAFMAISSCRTDHPPDVPAAPTGTDYCFKDSTYAFTAVASDPDGDSIAFRFDWGDSTTSHWEGWFASGETVAFTHAWSDTGNYEVRVSAQDKRPLTSNSSEGHKVLVALRRGPDAPARPLGPDSGYQDSSYEFQTSASHPDSTFVAIRFAWGDGDTSDWTSFWYQNAPVQMEHAWSAPGTYEVTAQAKDVGEVMSLWSSPHAIIIRQSGRLRQVGQTFLPLDSSGFLIRVVNDGAEEVTTSWLEFSDTPDSAYMRDFRIDADRCGYPIPDGMPGTGLGDTVYFTAQMTVAPDMSQIVELYFAAFFDREFYPPGTTINVHGKTFEFRFSDGSVITVRP
jgi:hypothetical protein